MTQALGVRFRCQRGCTACCNQKGWVYLTEEDAQKAARFLRLTVEDFKAKYVVQGKNFLRLRKPVDRQCPFLEPQGCSIHPAKPTQCRLFPFWPELLEDRSRWEATAIFCPGIGRGPLIQIGTALEMAQEMKRAYPEQYDEV
ncbi:MAG: YkgJ family cysteine cluster protein [Bryobacteraceae bacterium]|nr:YkgJ family cysteine cluster protein [Bryobacteraceae bacterium]MDW8376749.1 YkgJ family cysteine cluster protein [Bryobacterales bacterium]